MKKTIFAAVVFTGIAVMSTGFASELQEGQLIRLEPAAIQLSGVENHSSFGHQPDWQAGNHRNGQFENEGQGRPDRDNNSGGQSPEPPKDENGKPLPPPDGGHGGPHRDNNGGGQPPEPPKDENGNPLPPPDGGHGGPHRGGHEADRGVIR